MTVTIYKHWIGLLYLCLGGGFVIGVILSYGINAPIDQTQRLICYALAVLALIALILALITYLLHRIVINDFGITYYAYSTPFTRKATSCEWRDVEDCNVDQRSLLATLLGYGTLTVQTAGTLVNLTMTRVEDARYWQREINTRSSTQDTTP